MIRALAAMLQQVQVGRVARPGPRRLRRTGAVGGIYLGDPASPTFAGSRAAAVEHGLAHEVLTAAEVRERFPTMDPADDAMAVYEENAGYVRPEETVVAQAEVAARSGADLRFGERVRSWSTSSRPTATSRSTASP